MTTIAGFDLGGWADSLGYHEFGRSQPGDLVCVGDPEVAWYLVEREGVVAAEISSRGSRRGLGAGPDEEGSLKILILEMGRAERRRRGLRDIDGPPAADVEIEEGPTAFHLRWTEGWLDVRRGLLADRLARQLSRAVRRPIRDLVASIEAPNGGPLYRVVGPAPDAP